MEEQATKNKPEKQSDKISGKKQKIVDFSSKITNTLGPGAYNLDSKITSKKSFRCFVHDQEKLKKKKQYRLYLSQNNNPPPGTYNIVLRNQIYQKKYWSQQEKSPKMGLEPRFIPNNSIVKTEFNNDVHKKYELNYRGFCDSKLKNISSFAFGKSKRPSFAKAVHF